MFIFAVPRGVKGTTSPCSRSKLFCLYNVSVTTVSGRRKKLNAERKGSEE